MKDEMNKAQSGERTFDENQKKAITVSRNAVVSAGAGSGKTTVLAERFSYLVTEKHYNADQILTLTFTKKATVEMSDRIYKVLKKKAPEQAAQFFKSNIKTLDSYCNSVAKTGAHLYGISPDFTQDDETISEQVYNMALPFILEHRDNFAVKTLVKTDSFDKIAKELFVQPVLENSTVSSPVDFDACIQKQHEEILCAWKENAAHADKTVNALLNSFNQFDGNKGTQTYKTLYDVLGNPESFPEVPPLYIEDIQKSDSAKIERYALFINRLEKLPLPRGKGVEEIKDCLNELRVVSPVLISLVNYVSGFYITKELIPLLQEFQEKVNGLKRATGVLTFRDVSSLALCILRDHPDLRKIEKEKYKAIMIDEFQDNNAIQRDMLFLLAERPERMETGVPSVEELCPDKLFFVGDEKQSIYKFRGADVSVFRALSNDFSDGNLSMATNYRSHQSLIAAFNTIFGGCAFPPEHGKNAARSGEQAEGTEKQPAVFYTTKDVSEGRPVPEYEAVYSEVTLSKSAQEEAETPGMAEKLYTPHIHLALYDKNQEALDGFLTEEEAEAKWTAEKIHQLITEGADGGKPVKPGDIAILLKSYSLQPMYERTLLNHGIPYNTETVTGFFSDGPVNDIFAFLRLCVYEEDSLSYAQILRSPMVNLSSEETNAIITLSLPPFSDDSAVQSVLEEEAFNRYLRAGIFFNELKSFSRNEPLTKTVTKLWYESGYCYETMWNQTVSMYGKMYDLIFELARQSEEQNMSLASFVDSVRTYQNQAEKLEGMDIPLEQADGVHILSIHKSKGLEYPVVFICATHKGSMRDRNANAVYSSKEYGITVNTPPSAAFPDSKSNYFYQKTADLEKARRYAELRRLVYVALTRAKDQLYITNGKYAYTENAAEKYSPGGNGALESIYNVLEPVINFYLSEEYKGAKPFSVEYIPPMERTFESTAQKRKNSGAEKQKLIAELNANGTYKNAETVEKDDVPRLYLSPSHLYGADDETFIQGRKVTTANTAASPENVPYPEINRIIEESIPAAAKENSGTGDDFISREPRFSPADFGTIAHTYLEAAVKQTEPVLSNTAIAGIADNKKNLKTVLEICTEMAEEFKKSPLGKEASCSTWHKAEYQFKSRIGKKIVRGTIDLVFKSADGSYTIVDYKTNQTMNPELYYVQLACYRQAVQEMLAVPDDVKIRCVLYYLRYHKEIDITEECCRTDIEKSISSFEN